MKNIWHFPTWYPHRHNMSLGSFVKKQILAAASFSRQIVFFVFEDSKIQKDFEITIHQVGNVMEIYVAFYPSKTKFGTLRKKKKAYQMAIKEVVEKNYLPNFIHAHSISFASFFGQKTANKYQIKWFLSEHWSGFLPASNGFGRMPFYKKKIWLNHANQANQIISISETLKKAMIQCGITKSNYKIIPNVVEGLAPQEQTNRNKEFNEVNDFIFLNVSDMVDEIKNVSGVIRVFNQLWKTNKTIQLWLIGDGVDLSHLINMTEQLPCNKSIKFFGRLSPDEVLELYPQINTTIINSRYETFSVVAAESIYAGKPLIATRCGGPEEFITKNQGILITTNNDQELLSAMKTMISSSDNYIPTTLHQYINEKFSSQVISDKFKELYR